MSSPEPPTIFVTAGEASGDTHAANMISALARRLDGARFVGVGGPRMAEAGCELLADVTAHASMWLDVLAKIPYYRRLIRTVAEQMRRRRPAVLVPVDSPGLNWHLAAAARRLGIPVMYYIAPQVWAWASWRVKKARRLTDHIACILPFEQEYFRQRGVAATYVGHPMFDHVPPRPPAVPSPPDDGAWRVLLLPGSRVKEIRRHAPAMVRAAELICRQFPRATFTFAAVDRRCAELVADSAGTSLPIIAGRTHRLLVESHFALATSGTVTLETAYFGVPMVVFYRVSRVTCALFSWWLSHTRYYSLVNILAQREVVPEFMPWFGNADVLAEAVIGRLKDPQALVKTSQELIALTDPLKSPLGTSASAAVADLVVRTMQKN